MPQADKIVTRCRLCERGLTAANRLDSGRYSCPDCAASSRTAQLGWLPRAEIVLPPKITEQAAGLQPIGFDPKMFHLAADGSPLEREATCECGAAFTQRMLSHRWLKMLEKRSARAVAMFEQQIPGGFVPVHCPPCERRDIGRRATVDSHRHDFHEPADAAD